MNYGKLKRALQGIINRKDLTDALAGDFVNRAISECQRPARLAASELLLVADGWDGTNNAIAVPGNYLELVDIFTDCRVLDGVDKNRFLHMDATGTPEVYHRAGDRWLIRPTPPAGSRLYVQYFTDSAELIDDTDVNVWTKAGFNAVMYEAAALAADYFQMEDEYVKRFQTKATDFMQTIMAQEHDDRWSGTHRVSRHGGDY